MKRRPSADARADAYADERTEDVDLADVVEDEAAQAVEEIGDEEILDEIEAPAEEAAGPPSLPPPSPTGARRGPGLGSTFETPWEELAQAYESLPADDQKTRHGYLLKIAEIWERGQHDVGRALAALDRAFNIDPANITVRAELQRIGREYKQWDRVSDIYLSAVDEFGPIENAVALHLEVARFRDELGQIDKSEQLYNAILRLKSDDVTALDRIEQIYRIAGAVGRSVEPARTAHQRADRVAAARPRAAREVPRAGRALRDQARKALRGHRHAGAVRHRDRGRGRSRARRGERATTRRSRGVDSGARERLRIAGAALLARRPVGQRGREPAAPGRPDARQEQAPRPAPAHRHRLREGAGAGRARRRSVRGAAGADPRRSRGAGRARSPARVARSLRGPAGDPRAARGVPRPASSAARSCGGARRSSRRSSATRRRRRRRCASWAPRRSPTTR